jgi:4-alpha-glucanotransferase
MKRVSTIFAVHNHQPIGNFDSVIEEAYEKSYRPFLDVLERHPSVKFTQHWTGTLLEWLAGRHPDLIRRMKAMVQRGQMEILTGSYYEAILAIIPEEDRIGQIRKLSGLIHRLFGVEPEGMWLAERVWEQPLVGSLVKAGVKFVMVDDTHFRHAGLTDEQLYGRYITEEQGACLNVLPIDKTLRYTIPFRGIEESARYFEAVATEDGRRVVVHADDGEKFGVWPKTYHTVYEQGWLENFCRMLEERQAWLSTVHAAEVVATTPAWGRIYLPTASYSEMMKWALGPASFLHLEKFENELKERNAYDSNAMFVRGGYWRNFLAKYPEANQMHKKMLRVAARVRALEETRRVPQGIYDHLWAGQCNDPYWHGVFGGLYLPNLRYPAYHHLLLAEAKLDALEKSAGVTITTTDFDCDGTDEVLIESPEMNLYISPAVGGSMVELDYKPAALNLLDIVSRREEGYHRRLREAGGMTREHAHAHDAVLVKEAGLHEHLHFDWYRHASLVDHFFDAETDLIGMSRCAYGEIGDFVNLPYAVSVRTVKGEARVALRREGAIWEGGKPHRVTVEKIIRYVPGTGAYTVDYLLKNGEETPVDIRFGVEFNVGLMAGDAHDRYYLLDGVRPSDPRLRSLGASENVTAVRLVDEWLKVETEISVDRPATLWRFPIETVSLSEGGFERLYQSSVVVPFWETRLEKEFRVSVSQALRRHA